MTILALLNRVNSSLIDPPHPIISTKEAMRRSYLLGVAMQAHSDRHLDDMEKTYFLRMARLFKIEEEEALQVLAQAEDPAESTVKELRENLILTKYKYYFILDLQIMAHQDRHVKAVETEVLKQFGTLLEVDGSDLDFLTQLADAVVERDLDAKRQWVEEFFSSLTIRQMAAPDDFAHYTDDSNFHDS